MRVLPLSLAESVVLLCDDLKLFNAAFFKTHAGLEVSVIDCHDPADHHHLGIPCGKAPVPGVLGIKKTSDRL